jgi:hypothetical protein
MQNDFIFKAVVMDNKLNKKNYPDLNNGDIVYGYYVKARGFHYILQYWNKESGYDERWEASEWVEVIGSTVELTKI